MTPPKLFISLRSSVKPFNFPPDLLRRLWEDFPQYAVEEIDSTEELNARIDEPDVVVCWHFPADLYARAGNLKLVCTPAAGKDWVAQDPAGHVRTVYGAFHGHMIAESLLGMILHFNHRNDLLLANQRRRKWDRDVQADTRLLRGQHVLFVGYGTIGRLCARVLRRFDVKMKGLQRTHRDGRDPETGVAYITAEGLDNALAEANHVVLVLPGKRTTDGFFTREHFERMKPTAFLYNFGRGNCYAESDLVWALRNGQIAGAGLDVFAEEPLSAGSRLWAMENVLISPHSSCIYVDYMYLYYEELKDVLRASGMHG